MKIPNKKIFAYIKKYDKLDFLDVRDKSTFNKFKVKDITHLVLQKVKSSGNTRTFNDHAFCYFYKTEENNKNIYYGALGGYFRENPKVFYTLFRDNIDENGYTYLLYPDRFVVEFKKNLFTNDT